MGQSYVLFSYWGLFCEFVCFFCDNNVSKPTFPSPKPKNKNIFFIKTPTIAEYRKIIGTTFAYRFTTFYFNPLFNSALVTGQYLHYFFLIQFPCRFLDAKIVMSKFYFCT